MDRLTHREEDGTPRVWVYADPDNPAEVIVERSRKEKAVLEKLAKYEDMEEQGLFVRQQFGRWEKDNNNPKDGNYTCSCCKEGVDIATGEETPIDRGLNYCPNCGAKM
jgi:hypothetical protein|nr:MAG TPA: zinc-ribbon domain protein [Caudoviricetes sp.]